mmetsp:Transcript_10911/g.32701  ORF Transcript_10911/g.32701 Transcript_10911/m.32701 type:complete len:245 (+) Transcript_10911:2114-2848(+)
MSWPPVVGSQQVQRLLKSVPLQPASDHPGGVAASYAQRVRARLQGSPLGGDRGVGQCALLHLPPHIPQRPVNKCACTLIAQLLSQLSVVCYGIGRHAQLDQLVHTDAEDLKQHGLNLFHTVLGEDIQHPIQSPSPSCYATHQFLQEALIPGAQSSGVLGVKGRNVLSEAIRERIVKLDTDEVLDSLRSGGLLRNFHQILDGGICPPAFSLRSLQLFLRRQLCSFIRRCRCYQLSPLLLRNSIQS